MNNFSIEDLRISLFEHLEYKTKEYQRAFHGRGGCYDGFEFLTVDYINTVVYVAFYNRIDKTLEDNIMNVLHELFLTKKFEVIVLQRRYEEKSSYEIIAGALPKEVIAYENDFQFVLNLKENQNIGFFADMKQGRAFVKMHANKKNVLNLFSYTCAFSVYAMAGNAAQVVNVDMSKNALTTGRKNHYLNNLDTRHVKFMPYNILKSWSRIKKAGPYDMIIIDPPSFQKGSFAATKDYVKIIKRLPSLVNKECLILACLNDPKLDVKFLKDIFSEYLPQSIFEQRLENVKEFKSSHEESSLKNLVFRVVL